MFVGNDKRTYKLLNARVVYLPNNRYVMVCDTLEKEDESYKGKMLIFRNSLGKLTYVGLTQEAYDALKLLMNDPDKGEPFPVQRFSFKEVESEWRLADLDQVLKFSF